MSYLETFDLYGCYGTYRESIFPKAKTQGNLRKMAKGPGRSYRNGITLVELMDMFPDEETAEYWFEDVIWPEGRTCPECDSENTYVCKGKAKVPYRCRDCLKYFSVKTGTVMRNSPIPLRKWAIAIFLNLVSLKGVSSMRLHRDIGISQKSAWHIQHRIREAFKEDARWKRMFENAVEADESYFGGRKKKHIKGRGVVGKAIVAGVKERETPSRFGLSSSPIRRSLRFTSSSWTTSTPLAQHCSRTRTGPTLVS